VTGVAEIRYGTPRRPGEAAAGDRCRRHDGARSRTDATVDVALGPHFHALAKTTVIEHAISQLTASAPRRPRTADRSTIARDAQRRALDQSETRARRHP